MSQKQIIGIVILIVGIVLLYFGYNQTQSMAGEVSEAVTGGYTDRTMLFLIVGAVGVVAGLLLAFVGRR